MRIGKGPELPQIVNLQGVGVKVRAEIVRPDPTDVAVLAPDQQRGEEGETIHGILYINHSTWPAATCGSKKNVTSM